MTVEEERDRWKERCLQECQLQSKYRELYEQTLKRAEQAESELREARVAAQHIMELGVWQRVQIKLKERWPWLEVDP